MYLNFTKSALVVLTAITVTACKKGDEDPALSLLTRKNRICGTWDLASRIYTRTVINDGNTFAESSTTSGNNMTFNYSDHQTTGTYSENSLIINRDGTWTRIANYTYQDITDNEEYTRTKNGLHQAEQSGIWAFEHKSADGYKNRERVTFHILKMDITATRLSETTVYKNDPGNPVSEGESAVTYHYTYSAAVRAMTYDLIMLKNKEMKWELIENYTTSNTWTESPEEQLSEYLESERIVWIAR